MNMFSCLCMGFVIFIFIGCNKNYNDEHVFMFVCGFYYNYIYWLKKTITMNMFLCLCMVFIIIIFIG